MRVRVRVRVILPRAGIPPDRERRHHVPRLHEPRARERERFHEPRSSTRYRWVRVRVRVVLPRAGIQRDRGHASTSHVPTFHEPRATSHVHANENGSTSHVRLYASTRCQRSAQTNVDHPTRTKRRAWHPARVRAGSHARLSRPSWSSRREGTDPSSRRHIVVVIFVVLFVIVVVTLTAEPGIPTGWRWRGRRFRHRSQSSRRPAVPPGRPRSGWQPRPGPYRSR